MSQYDMTIMYIPGEDNTVADALSRVPDGAFPGESPEKLMYLICSWSAASRSMTDRHAS
jgi:hypothetical protein